MINTKKHNKHTHTKKTENPLVYTNYGDDSHRGQGHQAWTAVGLPPRYPQCKERRWGREHDR